MFKIGMKVVCVNAENQRIGGLVLGDVYEVVALHDIFPWIYVNGFSYPHYNYRFRPVQDQYTEEEIEAVNIDELIKEKELIQI